MAPKRRNTIAKHALRATVGSVAADDETKHLHTTGFHIRYATCQVAFWLSSLAFGTQDNLYVLGYKADLGTTATISLISIVATLAFTVLMGQLQDLEYLARWYPVEKWGRRAGWYKTHLLFLGPALCLVFNPPAAQLCRCRDYNKPFELDGKVAYEMMEVVCADDIYSDGAELLNTTGGEAVKLSTCSSEDESCAASAGQVWRDDDNTTDINQGCLAGEQCVPCGSRWSCESVCEEVSSNATGADATAKDGAKVQDPAELCPDGTPKYKYLDRVFLTAFSVILLCFCNWLTTGLRVAMNSALFEIFPFDKERIRVVGHLELFFTIVIPLLGIAGAPIIFVTGYPSSPMWSTYATGIMLWLFTLISWPSIETMKDADQSAVTLDTSPLQNLVAVFKHHAFRRFAISEFLHAVVGGINSLFGIYYLVWVCHLTPKESSQPYLLWAMAGLFTGLAAQPFWLWLFARTGPLMPKKCIQLGLCLHVITAPVIFMLAYLDVISFFLAFLLDFIVYCILKSPREYWRVMTLGIVIDDDSHALGGARREGSFVSATLVLKGISGGVVPQLLAIGMALAGIDSTKDDLVTTPCFHEYVLDQPQSGVTYLVMMFMLVNPVVNLMQAISIEFFPLYPGTAGHKAVVERQLQSFKVPGTSTHSVRRFSTMPPGGLVSDMSSSAVAPA